MYLYVYYLGVVPLDAFSEIPYIKGNLFMWNLHNLVGRKSFFEFLKKYIKKFSYRSIDSQDFKQYFEKHFPPRYWVKILNYFLINQNPISL